MIDDATLTKWGTFQVDSLCDHRACGQVEAALGEAIEEIQRLRHALSETWYEECAKERDDTLADLAAHQAVIRELASVMEIAETMHKGSGCPGSCWYPHDLIKMKLAHPLVVAARKG